MIAGKGLLAMFDKDTVTAINISLHSGVRDPLIDEKIVTFARSGNQAIKREAMKALRGFNDQKFQMVFINALTDPDWSVRGNAILGLKAIDPNCKNMLQIRDLFKNETHPFCRWCLNEL